MDDEDIDILGDSDDDLDVLPNPTVRIHKGLEPPPPLSPQVPLKKRILESKPHPSKDSKTSGSKKIKTTEKSKSSTVTQIAKGPAKGVKSRPASKESSDRSETKDKDKDKDKKKKKKSSDGDGAGSSKREKWSGEQQELFLKAVQLYHRNYQKIQEYVKTKTLSQVRSHTQKYFKKLEAKGDDGGRQPTVGGKSVARPSGTGSGVGGKSLPRQTSVGGKSIARLNSTGNGVGGKSVKSASHVGGKSLKAIAAVNSYNRNQLNGPDEYTASPTWDKTEIDKFVQGLSIYGNGKWKEIASLIRTKTADQVKGYSIKYFKKNNVEKIVRSGGVIHYGGVSSEEDVNINEEDVNINDEDDEDIDIGDDHPEKTNTSVQVDIESFTDASGASDHDSDSDTSSHSESESEKEDHRRSPRVSGKSLSSVASNSVSAASRNSERILNTQLITEEEKRGCGEFFTGTSVASTPERYKKIRNGLLSQWLKTKPYYLKVTTARANLKDCGDVNSISKVHKFLESIGAINFNAIEKPKLKKKAAYFESPKSSPTFNPNKPITWDILPGTQRKRKVYFNGDWVDPSDIPSEEKPNTSASAPLKQPKAQKASLGNGFTNYYYYDPFTLIPCTPFSRSDKKQPFSLDVSSNSQIVMDIHSHVSNTEVIGMLAGKYYPENKHISVLMAIPCHSKSTDIQCEMDDLSLLQAKELVSSINLEFVGWYHSHPNFDPLPSLRDIETQTSYQKLFGKDKKDNIEPFVGIIVNPYYQNEDGVIQDCSNFKFLTVSEEWSSDHHHRLPYELSIKKTPCHNFSYLLEQIQAIYSQFKDYPYRTNLLKSIGAERNYLDKMLQSIKSNVRLIEEKEHQNSESLLSHIRSLFSDFTTDAGLPKDPTKSSPKPTTLPPQIVEENCDIENIIDEEIESGESSDEFYCDSDLNNSDEESESDSESESSSSSSGSYDTNDNFSDNEIFNHKYTAQTHPAMHFPPIIPTASFPFDVDPHTGSSALDTSFTNPFGSAGHHSQHPQSHLSSTHSPSFMKHHHFHHHNVGHHQHHHHTGSPSSSLLFLSPMSPSSKTPIIDTSSVGANSHTSSSVADQSVDLWLAPFSGNSNQILKEEEQQQQQSQP